MAGNTFENLCVSGRSAQCARAFGIALAAAVIVVALAAPAARAQSDAAADIAAPAATAIAAPAGDAGGSSSSATSTSASAAPPQADVDGEHILTRDTEFRVWFSGGHALNGPTAYDAVWDAGVRYGWVITDPFLHGFARGRFEYAVDFLPVYRIYQRPVAAYGMGFDPIALKWNFASHRAVVPYIESTGGVLFTTVTVPHGSSDVNFMDSAAFGTHWFVGKFDVNTEIRYQHISNAGLKIPNPGINTLQARIGIGLFSHHPKAGH